MKKFVLFILFLAVLIVSEYYFFVEIFSTQRISVWLPSAILMSLSLIGLFRFTKRVIFNSNEQG